MILIFYIFVILIIISKITTIRAFTSFKVNANIEPDQTNQIPITITLLYSNLDPFRSLSLLLYPRNAQEDFQVIERSKILLLTSRY